MTYITFLTGILTRLHTSIAFQTLASAFQNPIRPPFLSIDRTPFHYALESQGARSSTELSGQRVNRRSFILILILILID